ncbi:MAG: alpha/beta fold hydrolase [Candidatus Limnocylindrales bacterium]
MTTRTITTQTLDVPGATLAYDVRPAEAGRASLDQPVLLFVGSPMAASGFAALAERFGDRTVATYDPRGCERSVKADPDSTSTPEQHADDIHRVIAALGGGPVDLFASSGGAVNALALVAAHPEDVRTLVAHEPPLALILPDREPALAAVRSVGAAYQQRGFGAGMAKFIAVTGRRGPLTAEDAALPGPDPAMFGLPTADDGARDDPLLYQNLESCVSFVPDFDALRAAPTRIVPGAGEETSGQLANRGAHAVAERLGTSVVMFPSHHGGFVGGDGPYSGQPDAFAAMLHQVLAAGA